MIRNLFQDIITILCTSPNNQRYDKLPKINETDDFKVDNIKRKHNFFYEYFTRYYYTF